MADKANTIRIKRRWMRVATIVGVTALVLAPVAALASHQFTDVPDSHTFHADISWLADNSITLGCNPPANDQYCPSDAVNRGQMAAFMHRLADNQVVDAGKLGGEAPEAYTTQIDAASQDYYVGTTPGSFTDFVKLLELTVDVPVDSYSAVSGTASFYKGSAGAVELAVWVQLDNTTCADYQDTMPGGRTWFSIGEDASPLTYANGSVSAAAALSAGSHTLTLCAQSLDSAAINIIDSALTSVSSATGTVVAPTGTGGSGPAADPGN